MERNPVRQNCSDVSQQEQDDNVPNNEESFLWHNDVLFRHCSHSFLFFVLDVLGGTKHLDLLPFGALFKVSVSVNHEVLRNLLVTMGNGQNLHFNRFMGES